jgi:hypothetical protein
MVNMIDLVKIRDIMNDPKSAWLDQFDEIFIAGPPLQSIDSGLFIPL